MGSKKIKFPRITGMRVTKTQDLTLVGDCFSNIVPNELEFDIEFKDFNLIVSVPHSRAAKYKSHWGLLRWLSSLVKRQVSLHEEKGIFSKGEFKPNEGMYAEVVFSFITAKVSGVKVNISGKDWEDQIIAYVRKLVYTAIP